MTEGQILEFDQYCVQQCGVLFLLKGCYTRKTDGWTNCSCCDQLFWQRKLLINCLCHQSFYMLFHGPFSSRTLDIVMFSYVSHVKLCSYITFYVANSAGGNIRTNATHFVFFFIFPHRHTLTQTQTLISASNTKNCTCTMFFCIGGVDLLLFL